MRRHVPLLALTLVLSSGASACTTVRGAVDDTRAAVDDARASVEAGLQTLRWCTAAFRLGTAVANRDVAAARDAAQDLQQDAPEALRDELALVLDAVAQAEAGDNGALFSQEVRDAGQRVLAEARSRCDPSTRPGG